MGESYTLSPARSAQSSPPFHPSEWCITTARRGETGRLSAQNIMLYPRQRRVTAFGALFFFIFFAVFFAAWHTSRYPSLPDAWVDGLSFSPSSALSSSSSSRSSSSSSSPSSTASVSHDAALSNSTLGFSNIFVVGLPERSDKRDAISLAASLTGINVEWVEGIKGESIPDKAVPFGVSRKELMETNLGSWRGHMNALRR